MKYCDVKNPPVFTVEVNKWDKSTRDNGEELAVPIEGIFNNTVYNKAEIEKLKGKTLGGITLSVSGWNGFSFAISDPDIKTTSHIEIIYTFDSILIAQKANIRGRTEPGKLVLVASKLPAADIAIETICIVNRE